MKRFLPVLALSALLAVALGGCASEPSGTPLGTVQVRLTDAPGDIQAVHLAIVEVSVHRSAVTDSDSVEIEGEADGGWEVVMSEPKTVDLMALRDGVFTTLGIALVPAGHYTQIRLKLAAGSDVVVDDVAHPLVVPSGMQSGLKLIHPFTVPAEGFVDLLVDIDAKQSLVETGSGTWMLKPTAKVIESSGSGRSAAAGTGTRPQAL